MNTREIVIVIDQCILSDPRCQKLRTYHELGEISLKLGEKVPIELKSWEGPKGEKYNQMFAGYETIVNLAIFDDGGLKFPFSFYSQKELDEMEEIIFRYHNICQMTQENLTKLKMDVRQVFSAYRGKADFFVSDDNDILGKRNEIKEKFGLKILSLEEMIEELRNTL